MTLMGDLLSTADAVRLRTGLVGPVPPLALARAAGLLVCSMQMPQSARLDVRNQILFYDPSREWPESATLLACGCLLRTEHVRDTPDNRRGLAELLTSSRMRRLAPA